MAMMCRMDGKCTSGKGMCGHEKMILIVMVVMVPIMGRLVFHWF